MPAISDEFNEFAATFDAGKRQLVHRVLVADTQTPVSAYLKLAGGKPNCFLLESVEGGEIRGRFSVIGLEPDLIWRCRKGQAEINRTPHDENKFEADSLSPLESLRALMRQSEMPDTGDLPPMAAGLFGYFSYDMIREIEAIPDNNKTIVETDDALLLRPSLIAIFDRLKDSITLVTQVRPEDWDNARLAWDSAQARLARAIDDLDSQLPHTEIGNSDTQIPEPQANMEKSDLSFYGGKSQGLY